MPLRIQEQLLGMQYDAILPYLSERRLSPWIHAKTVPKAIESDRITAKQKIELKSLKQYVGASDVLLRRIVLVFCFHFLGKHFPHGNIDAPPPIYAHAARRSSA